MHQCIKVEEISPERTYKCHQKDALTDESVQKKIMKTYDIRFTAKNHIIMLCILAP